MFKNIDSISSFSVDDVSKAKEFYSGTLGLEIEDFPGRDELFFISHNGNKRHFVYGKPNHTPASFTILNFPVDNIEKAVKELKSKGIKFEHFDGEMGTDENGIHRRDGIGTAWFKDPAGNILALIEQK